MSGVRGDVRLIGRSERSERDLFLTVLDDPTTWSSDLSGVKAPFAVLCALDADGATGDALDGFASHLLSARCMYACAWGPGSARVHDAFDLVFIRETGGEWADDEHILTTWHHDESLDEALWFAIFNASLPYAEIQSVLAVVSPPYAEHVERRLADSEQLDDDVV